MKKFKIMLSMFMVLIIISVSVTPILAENIISTEQAIISDDLVVVMENSKDDEKIKVYLWYKDINQDEVDALTTRATGLTPESCAVIEEFPSTELLYSLRDGGADAESKMDAYLERTKPARNAERERTDIYSKKHMEISNEMYNQKSHNIRNTLSISDNDVKFSSQFAPMIIAEMTKDELENASKNSNIEEINLYHEYDSIEPSTLNDGGYYGRYSMNLDDVYNLYGLTGAGVDVGLIEKNIPGPVWLVEGGVTTDKLEELEIDLDEVNVVEADGITIYPSKNITSSEHSHSYNSFRVMAGSHTGIAKDINMYATQFRSTHIATDYKNVEAMFNLDNNSLLDVVEVNIAYKVPETIVENGETIINPEYAYSNLAKYYDHLVSYHNTTVVVAGGNELARFGDRICNPGMGYNVITVGGYDNNDNKNDTDDILEDFCWKNSIDGAYGCEKPDVIMPTNFPGGGTSVASPALTAQIALILELKPSLSLYPELIKAITLASCHRKANQSEILGGQETMEQGITERQGAGIPDGWSMVNIVCQGTYGHGVFTEFNADINFVQPTYGATNMNVSVAWLRNNTHLDDVLIDFDDIVLGQAANIDLSIYRNDEVIKTSTLSHSSTEMCYIDELTDDFNYKIKLTQGYPPTSVRYAYAWSTDNMYAPITINQDSINYIRNASNGKYITCDTETSTQQPILETVSSQTALNDAHSWIVKTNGNAYNISSGYGLTKLYLGQSNIVNGSSYTSQLSSIAQNINIQYNNDGTVSFLNSTKDKILSYSGSSLLWSTYGNTPTLKQKWYFEKVNYLCGDANMDGSLEVGDSTEGGESLPGLDQIFVQNYLINPYELSCLQYFLTDIDKDGVISILDASMISQFANDKYI